MVHDRSIPTGVGLGLRWAFIDQVTASTPVRFFEISPENYMGRGGYFPAELARVAADHPIATHGLSLNIGSADPLDDDYLRGLGSLLDQLGVRAHSDHLCWTGSDGRSLHDLLPLPTNRATVQHVADRVRRVQDRLGRPLVLENISYYLLPGTGMPEHEFLAEVLERADCRLLLDVNNVWVNAQNHGFNAFEYLRSIPLDRVERIHVAGGERLTQFDNLIIDTHGTEVSETVAAMMAWVVRRVGPVPVVYERDQAIPPLACLLDEVAQLQRVYDEALAEHPSLAVDKPGKGAAEDVSETSPPLAELQWGLSRAVLDVEPPDAQFPDRLARAGHATTIAPTIATIRALKPARLQVYRGLIRNSLRRTARAAFPRALARRGEAGFGKDFDAWMAGPGPVSRYLRDIPGELACWLTAAWREDPAIPPWLTSLLDLERVDWEVRARPSPELPSGLAPVDLNSRLAFDGSVTLLSYPWRVHELPEDPATTLEPAPGPVHLLVHRDPEHDVRYLELTPLAHELLERLRDGVALASAVQAAAIVSGQPLDDEVLARVGTLLADLVERGIIVGVVSGHAATAQPRP